MKLEKFKMFVCPTCKVADEVWYYTSGETADEDISQCLKCTFGFSVYAVCDKCGGAHARFYGCNTKGCKSMDYHYPHPEQEIQREL